MPSTGTRTVDVVVADDYQSPSSLDIDDRQPPLSSQTIEDICRSQTPEQFSIPPFTQEPDHYSSPYRSSQESDPEDLNFSQELREELEADVLYSDDDECSVVLSDYDTDNGTRERLQQAHVLTLEANIDAAFVLHEDEEGNAFYDPSNDMLTSDDAECDLQLSEEIVPDGEILDTTEGQSGSANVPTTTRTAQGEQELEGWEYASVLRTFNVSVNDVDYNLEGRFVAEANTVLDNVLSRVKSLRLEAQDCGDPKEVSGAPIVHVTRLECMEVFLPRSFLELVKKAANEGLTLRRKKLTTVEELQSIIIFHILCASYHESPSTVASKEEENCFLQMGITAERYKDVWSSFSTTNTRRCRVQRTQSGWRVQSSRASTLIFELEQGIASINREIMYVPGVTIFAFDEDHARLSSRELTTLSGLRQINNPCKALGPVNNAICSSLTYGFIAGHYYRPNEKTADTWVRLVQLVQGVPTIGALLPMPDAIFASDRGYNNQTSIRLMNETLQATGFGTHKRSLDYPFGFGQGKIMKKYRGRVISEQGCRALYSAKRKKGVRKGGFVEAIVYRESCTGRLAAMYHNNERLFGSENFTVVPKNTFRGGTDPTKVWALQIIFDSTYDSRDTHCPPDQEPTAGQTVRTSRTERSPEDGSSSEPLTHKKFKQVFGSVCHLTYYQSEDPVWFLLRAFAFTSRTTCLFFQVVAKDFERNITSMSIRLKALVVPGFDQPLPAVEEICYAKLKAIWTGVMDTIGVKMGTEPDCTVAAGIRGLVISLTWERIGSMKVEELRNVLNAAGKRPARSSRKANLVEQLKKLVCDVHNGAEEIEEPERLTEEDRLEAHCNNLMHKLRVASLKAWVMKPLVTTNGMKEGSLNEEHVLAALPYYLKSRREIVTRGEKLVDGQLTVQYVLKPCNGYHVGLLQTLGLVCQENNSMVADSPDGLCGLTDEYGDSFVAAVEVKTMTASRTIEEALEKQQRVGPFVVVEGLGSQVESNGIFKDMVPTTAYRLQCLHHAAVLDVAAVLFVVAKGSRSTNGEIIYVALLKFPSSLRNSYLKCIGCIQKVCFEWVGAPTKDVPEEYEELVKGEYASDLASFISYYSLSQALRSKVINAGNPLPPARMISPTSLVYWNALKGGVDEFSRAMTTFARTNVSENPVVSIVGRILSTQVTNAAIAHRYFLARSKGLLPQSTSEISPHQRGYYNSRKKVTRTETAGNFARRLAEEWIALKKSPIIDNLELIQSANGHENSVRVDPRFSDNIILNFNATNMRRIRLNTNLGHLKVKEQYTYCALCGWSYRYNKKNHRGGSKPRIWCAVCRQAICKTCWGIWHSHRQLVPAKPSLSKVRQIEQEEDQADRSRDFLQGLPLSKRCRSTDK